MIIKKGLNFLTKLRAIYVTLIDEEQITLSDTLLGTELHITLNPIAVIHVQLKRSTQQLSATTLPGTELYITLHPIEADPLITNKLCYANGYKN